MIRGKNRLATELATKYLQILISEGENFINKRKTVPEVEEWRYF